MGEYEDMVKRAIRECGLSAYEVAKRTGVHKASLSRILSGQRRMTLETLDRLAAVIGVKVMRVKPKAGRKAKMQRGDDLRGR